MRGIARLRNEIRHRRLDASSLLEVCDATEVEAMDEYMKLPFGADGRPCRCGDKMEHGDETFSVMAVADNGALVYWDENGVIGWQFASTCRHVKPSTVEEVLSDFAERVLNSGHQWGLDSDAVIGEFASKIMEVSDVGGV